MPKVNLHGVVKAIDAVHSQLRAEKKAAAPADAKALDRTHQEADGRPRRDHEALPEGPGRVAGREGREEDQVAAVRGIAPDAPDASPSAFP